jgi:hypothetical protein
VWSSEVTSQSRASSVEGCNDNSQNALRRSHITGRQRPNEPGRRNVYEGYVSVLAALHEAAQVIVGEPLLRAFGRGEKRHRNAEQEKLLMHGEARWRPLSI